MPIKPADTNGKKLALVVWGTKENGEDEVAVFTGIARWNCRHLSLERGENEPVFVLQDDWLERLQLVADELRETLLGADYSISLTIGNLPQGEDISKYVSTGMKWPNTKKEEE